MDTHDVVLREEDVLKEYKKVTVSRIDYTCSYFVDPRLYGANIHVKKISKFTHDSWVRVEFNSGQVVKFNVDYVLDLEEL